MKNKGIKAMPPENHFFAAKNTNILGGNGEILLQSEFLGVFDVMCNNIQVMS